MAKKAKASARKKAAPKKRAATDYLADIGEWMVPGVHLRTLAEKKGMFAGAASSYGPIQEDVQFRETLAREYNMFAVANEMKCLRVHPERGCYDFTQSDEMVAFARAHDMQVHGHVLLWHISQPAWWTQLPATREGLMDALSQHIHTVAGHFHGKLYAWDVVNESLEGDGTLSPTLWYRRIGPDYCDHAFRWAHEVDPDVKLFYNDFAAESKCPKADGMYKLVRGMVDRGVPIHGVGIQAHVSVENAPPPDELAANIERYDKLGLEVQITELTVSVDPDNGTKEERLSKQAQVYYDITRVGVEAKNCTAVITWGLSDKHNWERDGERDDYVGTLPWDQRYRQKPACYAMKRAFMEG
ncbi:MAG: endo-1,4-beta-xylanase [Planctomycetes bacterium]|nr:endo-1,4-beta-xylanase [Planctomycetota bacterium]